MTASDAGAVAARRGCGGLRFGRLHLSSTPSIVRPRRRTSLRLGDTRIGESPESILGRSRAWMMWLPWIAMMTVSVFEYGYGGAADTLQHPVDAPRALNLSSVV